MKVFISGVAGFLGSHLADACIAKGWEVGGCDNLMGGDLENVPSEVFFHNLDCSEVSQLSFLFRQWKPDVIYHAACHPHEGLSVFAPHTITRSVYDASVGIMTAACAAKVGRFIYMSSMARYGAQNAPFLETMEPKPQDPYGIAKVAAERTIELLGRLHGVETIVAVPHNIIGTRQKYDDPYRNVASIMINRMLQGKQPIIYGDGKQRRCFSSVADIIPIFVAMATDSAIHEIFNVGPDEPFITINELAQKIAKIIGMKLEPIYMADRPLEVKHANCSADKIRAWFSYQTRHRLEDTLSEMVASIRKKGVKPFSYYLRPQIINEKTPKTWTDQIM